MMPLERVRTRCRRTDRQRTHFRRARPLAHSLPAGTQTNASRALWVVPGHAKSNQLCDSSMLQHQQSIPGITNRVQMKIPSAETYRPGISDLSS